MKKRRIIIYLLMAAIFVIGILILAGIVIQANNVVRFGSLAAMICVAFIELLILAGLVLIFIKEVSPNSAISEKMAGLIKQRGIRSIS